MDPRCVRSRSASTRSTTRLNGRALSQCHHLHRQDRIRAKLTVPAVSGVEGSLIYFIGSGDRAWRDDFAPPSHAPRAASSRIDHFSNVVRRARIPELVAVLWRRARARSRSRRSRLPIPTARSSVASCAARTANCASPSTSPRAAQPASRAFSAPSAAPSFQQIALSSHDLFAAVEAAKASGVAFLPIPRQLLRRSHDPLRHRPRPARPHARARYPLRPGREDGEFSTSTPEPSRSAFSLRSSSAAITTCSAALNTPIRLAAQGSLTGSEQRSGG